MCCTCKINKRHMSLIAHLKNHVKSIKTFAKSYDYIITVIRSEEKKIFFLRIECSIKFCQCIFAIS